MSEDLQFRKATASDAERIAEIYNWYVANTVVTFETEPVSAREMGERISDKLVLFDWIIGELNKKIIGYAYFGPFRQRAAYFRTVESTVYLSQDSKGNGFGRKIYSAVIDSAGKKGFRELIGVIALPNPASVALHARLGFHEAGILRRVGYKFGEFHDVAIWQRSI